MDYSAIWEKENWMPPTKEESSEGISSIDKSDLQLVELVLAGDETAFEQIFSRYKRLVAVTVSRYFQQPEQIEEIIQVIFVKVFFEIGNFRGNHDFSLASWLGRISTNTCLDALRSQKRKPENRHGDLSADEMEALLDETADTIKNVENSLVERDLAEKLLSQLPAEDRAIMQMFYGEEMSIKEIAGVTGWSNSKVKIRAYRARNALKKVLKKFL